MPSTALFSRARTTARHARPSRLPARIALTGALGGMLLPMALSSPASAGGREQSEVRVSAPGVMSSGGSATISVRLLSDGAWVKNGVVDVQMAEGSGWRTIAQAPTNEKGLGYARVSFRGDTPVRAHYRGSASRTAATSDSQTVAVRRAPARSNATAGASGNAILQEAAKHRGKPYRYGSTGPSSFDCSGFTSYVYRQVGKSIPRTSGGQEQAAKRVSKSAARPGDLVFIQDVAGHVGIYAGNGKMWDSPRSGKTVTLRNIWTSNYTIGRI